MYWSNKHPSPKRHSLNWCFVGCGGELVAEEAVERHFADTVWVSSPLRGTSHCKSIQSFLTEHLYHMIKCLICGSLLFWDYSALIHRVQGSLNTLTSIKILWIICCSLCSPQISTQLNIYRRCCMVTLNSISHHQLKKFLWKISAPFHLCQGTMKLF